MSLVGHPDGAEEDKDGLGQGPGEAKRRKKDRMLLGSYRGSRTAASRYWLATPGRLE